ncbi:MAG: immunoglobulin domain-containing protein [Bacteroidetes bacterium]|nr:immunoglobulin domain-containing protein [Bacteroidota bacterium]
MNLSTLPRKVRGLLLIAVAMVSTIGASAQINLLVTTTVVSYPNEVGFQLVNTSTNVAYSCLAPGGTPLTWNNVTISVPAGTYELRGWDSWGDGWNGCTYSLAYVTGGANIFNRVTMSGGGGSNTCTGVGTPITTGRGVVLGTAVITPPCFAPIITASPTSQSACTGTSVTFSVTSNMTAGTYEWRKDGVTLVTNRSNTYTVSPVTASSGGIYDVILRDDCNPSVATASSAGGRLTVSLAPTITQQPAATRVICAGQPDTLRIRAVATAMQLQWRKDGVNIPGATDSNYIIPNGIAAVIGNYDCVVSGQCSPAVTSSTCAVDVAFLPVVTSSPSDQTVCPGSTVTLTTTATVVGGTLSYNWIKNGVSIAGSNSPTLTLTNVQAADVGRYQCLVSRNGANPSNCNVTVGGREVVISVFSAPRITGQPTSAEACVGSTVTMSVAADGYDLTYQWFKNGAAIPNSNTNALELSRVSASSAGAYTVRVTGTCGFSVTSAPANLAVVARPVISASPQNASLLIGETLNLSVAGTDISSIKWMKNNTAIPGATSLSYSIANVKTSDAGVYNAIVTNSCGSVVTGSAVVKVTDPATLLPELTLSQSSIDAGDVPAEYSRTVTLTNFITNTGRAPLTVTDIAVENANGSGTFTISTGGSTPFTLAPGEMHSVGIVFAAPSVGSSTATLMVRSNTPAGPAGTPLTGNGVIHYTLPATLGFGKVIINNSLQSCADVVNTSSQSITLDQAQLSGANASLFTVVTTMPVTIAAGASTQVCFKFSPIALGDATASAKVISSNGGNSSFNLTGNGDDPTSVIEVAGTSELNAYPNPSSGSVTFAGSLLHAGTELVIMNSIGSVVASFTVNSDQPSIRWNDGTAQSGCYTALVRSNGTLRSLPITIIR